MGWQGVHGDLNETFLIGDVDEDSKKLVDVAYNALEKAITLGVYTLLCSIAGPFSAKSSRC